MVAPNLQGLNIVHPVQNLDSQDLLPVHPYPDLSAQLELWTNLPFDSEESPVLSGSESKYAKKMVGEDEEEDRLRDGPKSAAIHDGHINVVTGTTVANSQQHQQVPGPAFDLNSFLAGFHVDPFSATQPVQNQLPHTNAIAPSLAQLLLFHSAASGSQSPPKAPVASEKLAAEDMAQPPAKRARTRRTSVSTVDSPVESTPLSASEDKRRRNTAASARFRLKKKEREAALEGKAKELEARVNELERECEGLRRENGWLKGLVVGVTGAAQGTTVAGAPSAVTVTVWRARSTVTKFIAFISSAFHFLIMLLIMKIHVLLTFP
ncbi:uncharacterized protein BT62DRAFT_126873 [Guyanagaster necrorhizus]|uniref:BZIP domain-containing protein n=1 Tax=Guyanagaster necrorhizus TaxID=856835 RepID=A0A9P8ASP6_9AGAR|nr:uncharacterized protein BT62DRAFT_126873 [Guyanagaster necrorhizus MCA 3950]KAG7446554.1 hypothetical protein BT62DRAFT_126873 [Guyanagaster necrorhizus MCA 3950]